MEQYKFNIVNINEEEISKFNSDDQFLELGFELTKEVACFLITTAGLGELDSDDRPKLLDKNKAIIVGLIIRLTKLYQSFLDQIAQKRQEIVSILARCIVETAINIKYLLNEISDEKFQDFITYSLLNEKDFYELIKKNIDERGNILPIEERMLTSIKNSFEMSEIDIDNMPQKKLNQWKKDGIFGRFKSVEMEGFYSLYSMLCHSAHGNWQDLIMFNLNKEGDLFSSNLGWTYPDFRSMLPYNFIILDVCRKYLETYYYEFLDAHLMYIEDLIDRIGLLHALHEKFIHNEYKNHYQ